MKNMSRPSVNTGMLVQCAQITKTKRVRKKKYKTEVNVLPKRIIKYLFFHQSDLIFFLFLFLGSNTYSSVVLCATDEICSVILNDNISDVVTRQRTPQLLLIASCSTLLRSILHEEVLLFLLFVLARCGEPYYTITNLYASTFFDSQVCCLSCLYFF